MAADLKAIIRGATCMKKDPDPLMFRDLPTWIQDILRDLSREGFIYIGRTGPGLTYDFRKACMKVGTYKAIDEYMQYRSIEEKVLIELIATEGPRWVPYTRIKEFCETGTISVLVDRHPSQ